MGDRKNPIKFGPEWLRNLARDSPSNSNDPGASGEGARSAPDGNRQLVERMQEGRLLRLQQRQDRQQEQQRQRLGQQQQQQPQQQQQNAQNTTKVQLAKLRYGREEILALYDKNLEPPADLRSFELLYSPRGKPPIALSTSFEDDSRGESMRGPPMTTPPVPNFGISRSQGIPERSRTRSYSTFLLRQNSAPRYIRPMLNPPHHGDREIDNAYGETASSNAPNRSWNSGHTSNQMHRNTGDGNEWTPPKAFKRWTGPPTSWRRPQSSRDEESEWRSDGRPRATDENPRPISRWTEREKGDRMQKERPQSWHTNKRNMTPDSEDPLPEWAVDNADTYQGTFDSSGAFHGYSSDDSNIPKTPTEGNFVLSRSQTHGNFSRSKSVEEGSDEWWMSDKTKKFSNNKFDATDIRFKKQSSLPVGNEANDTSSDDHMFVKEPLMEESENDDNESIRKGAIKKVVSFDTKNFVRNELNSKPMSMLGHSQVEDTDTPEADLKFNRTIPAGCKPHLRKLARLKKETTFSQVSAGRSNNVITDLEDKDILQEEQTINMIPSPTFVSGPSLPSNHIQNCTVNSLASSSTGPAFPMLGTTVSRPTYFETAVPRRVMPEMINPLPPPNLALRMPYPGSQSLGFSVPTPRFSGVSRSARYPVFTPRSPMDDQNTGRNLLYLVQGNSANIVPKNDVPSQLATGTAPLFPTSNVHMMSNQKFGQSGFNPMQFETYSPPSTPPALPLPTQAFDMWYYQDPEKNIQGPFSPLDMANWYRAGYFDSNILVREASETQLKPLGCYGPVPPFMISLGYRPTFDPIKTETGYVNRTIPFEEQVDSLWGQQSPSTNRNWMQTPLEPRYNTHFWDSEPVAMPTKTLPETKDMKTEDQILAQIRAKQDIKEEEEVAGVKLAKSLRNFNSVDESLLDASRQKLSVLLQTDLYANKQPEPVAETLNNFSRTSNLDDIEKLIQKESLSNMASGNDLKIEKKSYTEHVNNINTTNDTVSPELLPQKSSDTTAISNTKAAQKNSSNKNVQEPKQKSAKSENQEQIKTEKNLENKENNALKLKNKNNKSKDKKDEDNPKVEKKIEESLPVKSKKEEKNKKDVEKDKKSQSSGVNTANLKGQDKGAIKKKTEETKVWQEVDKKAPKKESEPIEENKTLSNLKPSGAPDKEVLYSPKPTPILETFKKIPWTSEESNAVEKDGLTLTQIQRMERIRKMQEQQLLQFMAQQQQAAFDKELAALGWSQTKNQNLNSADLNLANIQAETRKQAAATTVSPPAEQAPAGLAAPALPWANLPNGVAAGFWDTEQQNQLGLKNNNSDKSKASNTKVMDSTKGKKKTSAPAIKTKKEVAAVQEFEAWCTATLIAWNTDVDVPTFVSFLKDIESPFEVKDYIKYYLGDTKDSSDFSRQFLEKRSKMLRVATTTPVDDLCSPALAINPKPTLNLDNQENKGKGKKSKKNKMQKIDSRILGFSVTAAQDRINVGDIDTV